MSKAEPRVLKDFIKEEFKKCFIKVIADDGIIAAGELTLRAKTLESVFCNIKSAKICDIERLMAEMFEVMLKQAREQQHVSLEILDVFLPHLRSILQFC